MLLELFRMCVNVLSVPSHSSRLLTSVAGVQPSFDCLVLHFISFSYFINIIETSPFPLNFNFILWRKHFYFTAGRRSWFGLNSQLCWFKDGWQTSRWCVQNEPKERVVWCFLVICDEFAHSKRCLVKICLIYHTPFFFFFFFWLHLW